MMSKKEKVEQLYSIYGFKKTDETECILVFTYSNGYFHNVEIVRFKENENVDEIKREYEKLGYYVRIIDYV